MPMAAWCHGSLWGGERLILTWNLFLPSKKGTGRADGELLPSPSSTHSVPPCSGCQVLGAGCQLGFDPCYLPLSLPTAPCMQGCLSLPPPPAHSPFGLPALSIPSHANLVPCPTTTTTVTFPSGSLHPTALCPGRCSTHAPKSPFLPLPTCLFPLARSHSPSLRVLCPPGGCPLSQTPPRLCPEPQGRCHSHPEGHRV